MQTIVRLVVLALVAVIQVSLAQDEYFIGDFREPPAQDGEIIYANSEEIEEAFNKSLTNNKKINARVLGDDEIKKLGEQLSAVDFETDVDDLLEGVDVKLETAEELARSTVISEANNYLRAYAKSNWVVYKCCPRKQNYHCGVNTQLLPPQRHWLYGWCYPLRKIFIRTCNCVQCSRLCPYCIQEGRCRPRFSPVSYVAVCWKKFWPILVHLQTVIPSSCYCDAPAC
ncbi:hypothetical protein Bpfe_003951 [Biomphalaria pfeifferi]|uniref:Uncharacterized protein n=1 Tax=Biomphalaria pfeifferi TaxID=112525 RepID=A0AAD8C6L8_BIOPF|nr:hypothetical protein Bpfe_003951 [Biomphalaria pfeifferi]